MTLGDIISAHIMYQKKEVEEWKRTRSMMYVMVKLWGDPKKAVGSIEEFFPLPGDESPSKLTDDDIANAFKELREKGWNV